MPVTQAKGDLHVLRTWYLVAPHSRVSLGFLARTSHLRFDSQIAFRAILVFRLFCRFIFSVTVLYMLVYERSIPYLRHLCFILHFEYMIKEYVAFTKITTRHNELQWRFSTLTLKKYKQGY